MIMGKAKVFDDIYSIIHFLYFMVITILNPILTIPSSLLYIAYQYYERERSVEKRGDFIEALAGILAGSVISWIL